MIHLRHILHPFRSAKSVYRRVNIYVYRRIAECHARSIRRSQQHRCWCGGELLSFKWHASYGVCSQCGCYVNQRPPLPEELKRIYSFETYWHIRARMKGHPVIEQRPANDRSDGRVDYWLRLIERYGPPTGRVIEIGCAHGVLLAELKARGYECIGVEPDERTADWSRRNMGLDVRPGFFPGISLPNCNLFLAFDVLEHSLNPLAFMKSAAQLLNPNGVVIVQSPIEYYEHEPPFGEMFGAVFDDLEHLFIFNLDSLHKLGKACGLRPITNDRWILGHEIVVLQRNLYES